MPPLYEYECPKCKCVIELQQKIKEKLNPLCCKESCNVEMNSIMSVNSFILKGSCWEKDGYK